MVKEKTLYMCYVDLKKAYDRVLMKVLEWTRMKKGIIEALVRSLMRLSENLMVYVDHQGSVS